MKSNPKHLEDTDSFTSDPKTQVDTSMDLKSVAKELGGLEDIEVTHPVVLALASEKASLLRRAGLTEVKSIPMPRLRRLVENEGQTKHGFNLAIIPRRLPDGTEQWTFSMPGLNFEAEVVIRRTIPEVIQTHVGEMIDV